MHYLDFVGSLAQPLADLFGDHHRAMLPARTSEADGQIALPFPDIMRQQVHQQIRNPADEFLRLRKRPDVLRNPRMPSSQRPELRHKMRIRKEAHIEYQI